jgi:MtN3 and saliva related transmembrane protein
LNLTEYLSLFAGLFITCSFVPQIIRVFRLKSAREISTIFTTLLLLGMALWLIYGVRMGLAPIILWNAIGIVQVILLLSAKVKYGR